MNRPFGVPALGTTDRLKAGLQTSGVPKDRFMVPMQVRSEKVSFHEPNSHIRMTNDEIRRNIEIRMTNPAITPLSAFDVQVSDFFRHLSFVIQ